MGQTVIDVTNGKIIRLLVDDEPFDIRYGTLRSHARVLDMRAGTLTREVVWSSPAGDPVKVTSVRLVSLTQRAIAAFNYRVEAVDARRRPVLLSEIVANEELPQRGKDPGWPPCWRTRWSARNTTPPTTPAGAGGAGARDPGERAAAGGRDGPRGHRPREDGDHQ